MKPFRSGVPYVSETVPAGKRIENIPVTITTRKSNVGFVKMFVWDNEEDMNPYHNAEVLFGE